MLPETLTRDIRSGFQVYLRPTVLAPVLVLFFASASLGQFKPCPPVTDPAQPSNQFAVVNQELELAVRAINALERLDDKVLIYRSLGEFERSGKFARVSFEEFKDEWHEVMNKVEQVLTVLPDGKLKREITNSLYSYRDGVFWWSKIHQPRVIHVSNFSFGEVTQKSSDTAYSATIPYTVVIHWRQANKYLKRAQALLSLR